jgi:ariadne-1
MAAHLTEEELLQAAIAASLEEYKNLETTEKKKPKAESSDDDEQYESMDEDDDNNSDDDNSGAEQMDYDDDSDIYGRSIPGSVRQSTDSIYNDQEEADGFQFEEEDTKKKDRSYEVLTVDDIVLKQTTSISKVCDFLNVPFSSARALLHYMSWDNEKLLERWADDAKTLCTKTGVEMPRDEDVKTQRNALAKVAPGECSVCGDDNDKIATLTCGHGLCGDCWKEFLSVHIKEKKKTILCPGFKCGRLLDEFLVLKLVNNKKMQQEFNQNLVASYVENNPFVKWCPAADCTYAIQLREVQSEHNEEVQCKCGHFFCFRCREEGHQPSYCNMFKDWKVKNSGGDDSLNEKAIASLARPCPRCKTNIEKNGGCNHMTCYKCRYHFCWQCMGKFGAGPDGDTSGYSNHKCNNYVEEDSKVKTDKEDWERYRWYAERYNNHFRSRKIEQRLIETSEEMRFKIQEETALSWTATQYYLDAIVQLINCRTVLMNSYIFGFYRPIQCPEVNKNLFEHRQNELERHTEQISRSLENKEPHDIAEARIEIMNISKLGQNSRRALIDVAVNVEHANSGARGWRAQSADDKIRVTYTKPKRGAKGQTDPANNNDRPDEEAIEQRAREKLERELAQKKEQEELEKALKASLSHASETEEEQLKKVLQMSVMETEVELTPEERDYQEALRLSMLENKTGGAAVATPTTKVTPKSDAKDKDKKDEKKDKKDEKKGPTTRSKAKK